MVGIGACGGERIALIQPSGLDFERVIVVRTTADLTPIALITPAPIAPSALSTRVDLGQTDETIAVIGLSNAQLASTHPRFSPGAADRVTIRLANQPASTLSADFAEVALPTTASIERFDSEARTLIDAAPAEAERLTKQLVLTVPLSLECKIPGKEVLQRLDPAPKCAPAARTDDILTVLRLDSTRTLASANTGLYLLRKGAPLDCAEQRVHLFHRSTVLRVAVAPRPEPDGRLRAAAITRFKIHEVLVGEDSLERVATTTVTPADYADLEKPEEFDLRDVAIDHEGNTIVVGDEGLVLVREPGGPFERIPFATERHEIIRDALYRIIAPRTGGPHIVAAIDLIYVGDIRNQASMRPLRLQTPINNVNVDALAERDGTIWIAGSTSGIGYLLRTDGMTNAVEVLPSYPARVDRCLESDLKRLISINAIALDASAAYVITECNAVIRINRNTDCVTVFKRGQDEVFSRVGDELRDASVTDGWLTVGGEEGQLFELDLN